MSGYQLQQVCLGILCVLSSVALATHAIRVRGAAARVEVAEIAALVGFLAGLSFLLSGYADGRDVGWAQAPLELLKNLPVPFTIAYACSVQARGYRVAWVRRGLRTLLKKAPHVLFVALILSVALPATRPYALPEADAQAPARTLLVEWFSSGSQLLFASLAAFVFFEAARTHAPDVRVRVQNLAAGIAMVLFAFEAIMYAAYWTVGTLGTAPLVGLVSSATFTLAVPLITLELLALFVAVVAFHGRSRTEKLAEKATDFFDCVSRISGILASAPVWKKGMNAPYAKLIEASGQEFLRLSPLEERRAAGAFRVASILKRHGASGEKSAGARAATQLPRLIALHDEALSDREFSCWLQCLSNRGRDQEPGPHTSEGGAHEGDHGPHEPLGPLLRLVNGHRRTDEISAESWEQLARLACVEAGLLPRVERTASERVRNAYELAGAKLRYGIV